MNDSKFLPLNEEEPNVDICDDEEEIDLLMNRPRMFKTITWRIGRR